jgi:hypothetical protein
MSLIDTDSTQFLFDNWMLAKEAEKLAIEKRREIEDELNIQFAIPVDLDGTVNREVDGYKVKIVGRLTHKVDSDRLQDIARENGLSDLLSKLFRWTPEIDMKAWKSSDKSITAILADAITTKPGRASYSIERKED